jgi:hypothetical protein
MKRAIILAGDRHGALRRLPSAMRYIPPDVTLRPRVQVGAQGAG